MLPKLGGLARERYCDDGTGSLIEDIVTDDYVRLRVSSGHESFEITHDPGDASRRVDAFDRLWA